MPGGPRLLYLLNVSNPDRLSADSGWVIADLLATAWSDAGVHVTLAAPAAVRDPRVEFIATLPPATKYRARFDADIAAMATLIRCARPDMVVVNQVEAASVVRAALVESGRSAILAGYCHYLPFSVTDTGVGIDPAMDDAGLGRSVLLHFTAGLAACDTVLVHSGIAAVWVTAAAAGAGVDLSGRVQIVPPPRDPSLVRADDAGAPADRIVGVYNHRLYAHYGTGQFLDVATELAGGQVEVMVMDLFGARRPARITLDDSPERFRAALAAVPGVQVVSDGGDRSRYRGFLEQAHFGIAPFRSGCPWSMSVIDCQGMGLPVISPRVGWAIDHIAPDLLFDTSAQAREIVDRLTRDQRFYRTHARAAQASTRALDPARIADDYLAAVA